MKYLCQARNGAASCADIYTQYRQQNVRAWRTLTVFSKMLMYPWEIIIEGLIEIQVGGFSLEALDSSYIPSLLCAIKASPFAPECRLGAYFRGCS